MLDFLSITTRSNRGMTEAYPDYIIKRPNDLMIKGRDFYAVWDEERGKWSTDEDDLIRLVDNELRAYADKFDDKPRCLYLSKASNNMITAWHKYCQKDMRDYYHPLDEKLVFNNSPVNKKDYSSKHLPYDLVEGPCPAWDKIVGTLYSPSERHKIEWAIGSIVTGDSKTLQKFLVFYGSAGTGKSTILNIIQNLFEGYYCVFDAKALGNPQAAFALEAFKSNPLVAIQHDGDLSKIEDNTRLNSIVSHEEMTVNEKFKSTYTSRFKCFLFMGTNRPVKITDAKSGLLRRLIDVSPTGKKISADEYNQLMAQVQFELGAIAWHCRDVYLENPRYYDNYVPLAMMNASNDFYNFVLDKYMIFSNQDGVELKQAWKMYNEYVDEARLQYPCNQRVFKEEFKNYFDEFHTTFTKEDGTKYTNYYVGFKKEKFEDNIVSPIIHDISQSNWLDMKPQYSLFDEYLKNCPAQYVREDGRLEHAWDKCTTKLSDIDTHKAHHVRTPENLVTVDIDISDGTGKNFELCKKEALKWPPTYAETSKSGNGIHLEYLYLGDTSKLSAVYSDKVEIKVGKGKSSLRRKLTICNDIPIATLSGGLPLKEAKPTISGKVIKDEKHLILLMKRALNKEYEPHSTICSIEFINKLLNDAYDSGIHYDVEFMRQSLIYFATNSTNNAEKCLKIVNQMKLQSEDTAPHIEASVKQIVFFDCEVFPNLLLISYKFQGYEKDVITMINPTPHDVELLLERNIVGFNNKEYDNHILYACTLGFNNAEIYALSQKLIKHKKGDFVGFREAKQLSYTDIHDYCATKQSLKKWEIAMGKETIETLTKKGFTEEEIKIIKRGGSHLELGLPWDEPVPEELWEKVASYCKNDVYATEALFIYTKADFIAREILAELTGMTVNDSTNNLTTKFIFGNERHPKLVYTNLATGEMDPPQPDIPHEYNAFPGYEFIDGKNMYRGTDLGKGGYAKGWEGIYWNVALLDVASLHPHSAKAMRYFGEYTQNFVDLIDTRVAIKHKDFEKAKTMFGGKLATYLDDPKKAKALAFALKIAINAVYGLTSASFNNAMKDERNVNNIVALRGALFMRTLQDEVTNRGYKVIHIKTDSIKIADASIDIIKFCMDFAKKYGYTFEHEATYEKICLINNAVYVAKTASKEWCMEHYGYCPEENEGEPEWTATGKTFQIPYVFKTLFSKEPIEFDDCCETFESKTALYLKDKNGNVKFIGKVGQFTPVKESEGMELVVQRTDKDGNIKYDSAPGAKGYFFAESDFIKESHKEMWIDRNFYKMLIDTALDKIHEQGDSEVFLDEKPIDIFDSPPWFNPSEPYSEEGELFDRR